MVPYIPWKKENVKVTGILVTWLKFQTTLILKCYFYLTLIGMRGGTFISLSFLDQILSADFLSKLSKLFEVKIDINRVILTLCSVFRIF